MGVKINLNVYSSFYIHAVVLLRGLPSLVGIIENFCGEKEEKAFSQIKSDQGVVCISLVRQTILNYLFLYHC